MAIISIAGHLLALILAVAVPASAGGLPVRLRLYMHDITGGPGQTAVQVVNGTGPLHPAMPPGSHFGDTMVVDDLLTDVDDSKPVGRAQGSYTLACLRAPVFVVSITLVLTDGPYKGSTILIAGRDDISEEVRELAVVGGTGKLRRATGHVLWTTARRESPVHMVLELDVYAWVPHLLRLAVGRHCCVAQTSSRLMLTTLILISNYYTLLLELVVHLSQPQQTFSFNNKKKDKMIDR